MQSGLVRRIDNLGRVVIPRQVREYIGVGQNGLLEFAVKGDVVLMRRFSSLSKLQSKAKAVLSVLASEQGVVAALLDGEQVIYATQTVEPQLVQKASGQKQRWQGIINNTKVLYLPISAPTSGDCALLLVGASADVTERVQFALALFGHFLNC